MGPALLLKNGVRIAKRNDFFYLPKISDRRTLDAAQAGKNLEVPPKFRPAAGLPLRGFPRSPGTP